MADARAENRVALVIGNGAYTDVPVLPNPPHDAADVAASLTRAGFDVILETNLDQRGMQDAAIRFARAARSADVALFYYSGHALQFSGINYLVPIDAVLRDEADLKRMARADEILADLQQARNLRILVLDACRENPFAENLKRSVGQGRGVYVGRGLARMDSPDGTIISYATQSGRTANDGDGRNSPYTNAFLSHIEDKENIATVFQSISAKVYDDTKGVQVPELSLSFFGEFYLSGKPEKTTVSTTPAPPSDPCTNAATHWQSAQAIGTVAAFEDHLHRFPACEFAGLARSKIAELSKSPEASKTVNRFDGIWVVKETCQSSGPWPAGNLQYAAKIKDGMMHNQYGAAGQPGSSLFDGRIEADGSAEIAVNGFTDASKDPIHRAQGTPFHYTFALKLQGDRGAGVRTETPRPCRSELSRLDPAMASPAAPAAAVEPGRHEGGSPNRGATGLSCTAMQGRCGTVCVANTGRPDCASTICVRMQQECLSTGCWRGRGFSGCGLAQR